MLGTVLVMQSQGIFSGACRDGSCQLDGEQSDDNETNEHVDCCKRKGRGVKLKVQGDGMIDQSTT